jgi:hypothetical protein
MIGLGGHGLMEGGVEHGHHGDVGHDLLAGADAGEVGGVVQGSQGDAVLDGGSTFVVMRTDLAKASPPCTTR